MVQNHFVNQMKELISNIHSTKVMYDKNSNTLVWEYNIRDSIGNTAYILSLNLDNGSVWYVGNVNDIINGIYCKKVYTERDVLEMLHSFKNDVNNWNC